MTKAKVVMLGLVIQDKKKGCEGKGMKSRTKKSMKSASLIVLYLPQLCPFQPYSNQTFNIVSCQLDNIPQNFSQPSMIRSSPKCSLQLHSTFVLDSPTTETSISRVLRVLGIMIDGSCCWLRRLVMVWWWRRIVGRFEGRADGGVTRITWLF